jgi:NitT/TauT family transport system permease protein
MTAKDLMVEEQRENDEAAQLEKEARRTEAKARRYRFGSLLVAIVLFGLWELLPRLDIVPEIILPPISATAYALYTLLLTDFFLDHFLVTLNEIFWGFVIGTVIGLAVGIFLGAWQAAKRVFYPFVVAFQAIPKIVLAPLLISWFGYGQTSKIAMAVVISFFPVLINTMVGLESVPKDMVRLMESLRASRQQIFTKVELPSAAPLMFAGVKTALTFALIGAIVGEFVGAAEGLGFLLYTYNFQLRIDRVFSVIIILSTIGGILYFFVEWLDKKLIYWRQD